LAQFNADILLNVVAKNVERELSKIESRLDKLSNAGRDFTEAFVAPRALKQIDRELATIAGRADTAAKRFARVVEGAGTLGVAAKGASDISQYLKELSVSAQNAQDSLASIPQAIKSIVPGLQPAVDITDLLSKTVGTAEYKFNSLAGAADNVLTGMNAVGGAIPAVTAAVAALAAIVEGQLSEALYDIDQTGSKALQQIATDAKAGTSELQRLIKAGEGTANQYEKLLQKGKARQGQYSALSREGRQSANTIAAATKLLNEELDRQNTLIKLATIRLREFGGQAQVLRNVRQSAFDRAESGFAVFSQSASRVDNQNAIDRSINRNRAKRIKESAGAIDDLQAALQRMEQRKVNWGDALGLDQISTAEGRANRLTQAWNSNAKAVTKAALATRELFKGAAGNALIGGAFPLLFGQGPAAAIGGGLGGLAGGLLGGQFGFALSLVGTALGDAVTRSEEFNRSLAGLNGSLSNSSSALRITTGDVEELAKQLSITNDEAVDLISTFSAFDDPATVKELARAFADVGGVSTAETLASITDERTAIEAIDKLRGEIGNKLAAQLIKQVELEGSQAASASLLDAVLSKQEKITDETQRTVTLWDRILSAFALSSGGVGIDPRELSPQAIAGDRADAIPEANKGVIDTAIKNLERFYTERDRLIKKFTPEREKKGRTPKDTSARDLAQSQGVLRQLQQQLAVAQANEGLDSSILRISQNYENTLKRIGELKDQSLAKEQAQAALQIRNAQINKAVQSFEEKRAESIDQVFKTLQNERAELLAVTDLQKDNLRVQQIVDQLERSKIFLNDKQLQQLRELIAGNRQLAQEKQSQLFLDQQLEAAINGIGRQAAGLMETLITGTDDWAASLNNALKSLASLLFNVGLSALGGGDKQGLFSILSGDFKVGARANGGPVSANRPYLVGEEGPEMFVPGKSGTIIPNGAGGGVNSVVNVTINGDGTSNVDSSQGAELGRLINSSVTAILMRERRPGGMLAR